MCLYHCITGIICNTIHPNLAQVKTESNCLSLCHAFEPCYFVVTSVTLCPYSSQFQLHRVSSLCPSPDPQCICLYGYSNQLPCYSIPSISFCICILFSVPVSLLLAPIAQHSHCRLKACFWVMDRKVANDMPLLSIVACSNSRCPRLCWFYWFMALINGMSLMFQVKFFIVICTTLTVKQSLAMKFLVPQAPSNNAQTICIKENHASKKEQRNLRHGQITLSTFQFTNGVCYSCFSVICRFLVVCYFD